MIGALISRQSFLAVNGVAGVFLQNDPGDEILGFFVESEIEVVMKCFINVLGLVEIGTEKLTCFLGGVDGCF